MAMARRKETKRQRLALVAMMVTALVCLFAFARLAPDLTLLVALAGFCGLVFFFWLAGKNKDR